MVKIPIINNIVQIKILAETDQPATIIEIRYGSYCLNVYQAIIVNNETVMLEGVETVILSTNAKRVDIDIPGLMSLISKAINNKDVYLQKMEAIPEGKEREILAYLMERPVEEEE